MPKYQIFTKHVPCYYKNRSDLSFYYDIKEMRGVIESSMKINKKTNNFDFLRILLAIIVAIVHLAELSKN